MRRFLQFTVLGAAAWIVAGCAPTVLAKSADGITFDNPTDSVATIDVVARYQRRQALDLADAHCRRFGRIARLTRRTADALRYDCVE
ncbi:MAG: hypothetical protein IIB63_03280 [Proteobacteria bacterium]|nr:hypothetical protein [Pseudomonadota bacterium]